MVRLSINEMTTYRWSFEEDVTRYAAAGIPAIGVWREKVSDYGASRAADILAETGLGVSNVLWAGGFTGSDGRTVRESIDDAVEAVRLTSQLGGGCLVVYSGSRAGHTYNHARRLVRDSLKEILAAAEDHDVQLALEPMHAGCACDWTFLTSLEDSLAFIDEIKSPRLRLAFDTYHLGFEAGVADRLDEIAKRIAIVHLGDGRDPPDREQNRCRLGEGAVPLREIVAALTAAGYDGYFDVELMGEEFESSDYAALVEHSKQAFAQLLACPTA
jgi:sugar phosphate isomerase/epimerase